MSQLRKYCRNLATLAVIASLTGCAACREHAVMCAASAVVVGAVAAHELDRGCHGPDKRARDPEWAR
jgi:hypothetical protein